jgi:hypothetical protein
MSVVPVTVDDEKVLPSSLLTLYKTLTKHCMSPRKLALEI